MSSITVRNLDPAIKERLRIRAAEHGHSMEAEARRILQAALSPGGKSPGRNLFECIHARLAPFGGSIWSCNRAGRLASTDVPATDVLSAMMTARPAPEVAAWVTGQPVERLFTTAVCQAEILATSPSCRTAAAGSALQRPRRCCPSTPTQPPSTPKAFRRRAGRPAATIDLMIGATAQSRGACVVTRNVADFTDCGVAVTSIHGLCSRLVAATLPAEATADVDKTPCPVEIASARWGKHEPSVSRSSSWPGLTLPSTRRGRWPGQARP